MTATILVVDDLEPNVKLLEAKLLSEYYAVVTASSGKEALTKLEDHNIDVILLDVMMPEMDGYETCKKIKANNKTAHIPVVMVTALSEVEDRIKGLESGADEFLTKPVNDIALFARVKSLSRIKTMIDELKLRQSANTAEGGFELEINNFDDASVIIVDDDIVQSKNVAKTIGKLTKNIKIVTDSTKLDEVIETFPADLIIISSQLENGDPLRISVSLKTKESLRYSSFVLMADEESTILVTKGLELGLNDYFIYPLDENELLARIKTQLKRKKYQDSLRQDLEHSVSMSVKDGLTGAYNRRYFEAHAERMLEESLSYEKPLSILMFDIDHFKNVNDTYGHQAGDDIIKGFANTIQDQIRATDMLARYGGEEFVVILRDANEEDAYAIAERIRSKVENSKFDIHGHKEPISITTSIGAASLKVDDRVASLLERADKALYTAKTSGRNRVVQG